MCITTQFKNMAKNKDLVSGLNEKAGKKIAFLGVDDTIDEVEVIPTGIMPLDYIIGAGGIPRGRITDLYGLPSAGKSSLCFTLIAQAQKMGLVCAFVDAEYSYSPEYVRSFGVDTDKLLVIQPDCMEEAGEAIEAIVRDKYGLIVVDSISALVPRAIAEADYGKPPMAHHARGVAQMMMRLVAPVKKNNTALVCINQMRVNIMSAHPGDKYTVTGGFALKFYASLRIEIRRLKALVRKEETIGYITCFKIVKNKLGRPGLSCQTTYLFGEGYQTEGDLVEMALGAGIIEQAGAFYTIGDKKYQGKEKASAAIDADPILKEKIITTLFPQHQA